MRKTIISLMLLCASVFAAHAQSTDISQLPDVLFIENTSAQPGDQITLSVQVNNSTIAVRGFQFDLYLPDGVTVAEDEDGFLLVLLSTERTTTRKMNYFDHAVLPDGALRVLCNSSGAYTFDGISGEVCTITVDVASDATGDLPLQVKNVVFTDPDANRYAIPDVTSKISVSGCDCGLFGDLNKDGEISVNDINVLVNLILGNQ